MLGIDPTAASAATALPPHLDWALAIAVVFSFVLSSVDISVESKRPLLSCLVFPSLFYFCIRTFGNVVATLFASAMVTKFDAGLTAYYFLFAAFLGIFGFEIILKHTNISIFDNGVLTFQAWIDKALRAASEAAIERDLQRTQISREQLAVRLSKIPEPELNAFVAINLGSQNPNIVQTLESAAKNNSANPSLYKGYAVATTVSRNQVMAFLKGQEKS